MRTPQNIFDMRYKSTKLLLMILGFQIVFIWYVNLTQLQYHIGYDASTYYLQAAEIVKQKTMILENWEYQTTLGWDTPIPVAALFMLFFKDIFLSYGLANLVCITGTTVLFVLLLRELEISLNMQIVCLIVFFTPYLSGGYSPANNLGYFSLMFASQGAYVVKVGFCLLLLLATYYLLKGKHTFRTRIFYLLSLIACLLEGISSGYYLLMFAVAPIIFYFVLRILITNSWRSAPCRNLVFCGLWTILTIFGKVFANKVMNFSSADGDVSLIGLLDVWNMLGSILLGFFELLGALPYNSTIKLLNIDALKYLPNLVLTLFCLVAVIFAAKRNLKDNKDFNSLISISTSMILFYLLFFTFANTRYGQQIFEVRYLIPMFLLIILSLGYFLQILSPTLILKKLSIVGLSCSVVLSGVWSMQAFLKADNHYTAMQEIKAIGDKLDVGLVFFYNGESILPRNQRIMDTSRIYKNIVDMKPHHWGDYTYYDDASEYNSSTAMFTSADQFMKLPPYIASCYSLRESIQQDGIDYNIYYSPKNPFDFRAGPADTMQLDYFYTPGMVTKNGEFDDSGKFITNGAEGFATFGPYCEVPSGHYTFTLNYSVLEKQVNSGALGFFDVAIGGVPIAQVDIYENTSTVSIENLELIPQNGKLEYRVYTQDGSILSLENVEIHINPS